MISNGRALVIESEPLLAMEIQQVLTEAGFAECRHWSSVGEAGSHWAELATLDVAIVEARRGAAEVVAFTEQLVRAGVPTVVTSADIASTLAFPHAVALGKPFDAAGLLAACDAARAVVS
jgi:DNA-binding NarL/FixJ family response regulator